MTKKWWHDKVAYQIYPKSFYDSNGDGIGDLKGITAKLDYLKYLGVDILWISPCYRSPMADQGYDISDYYQIDPCFGTMEDMDELLAEAKRRDMYVLMDLVVNHCSDEHEWFQKACADPEGEYGNFFYIRDCAEGKPYRNWRSYFGGPAWEPLPGHPEKQYLHLFHKKQPDLNWENPVVREEVYRNVNWWLDKGLGGFRIDAIINIKKPFPMVDYPADRPDGLCGTHEIYSHAEGIGEYLQELKKRTFAPHDSFTVGEVVGATDEELADYVGEDGYFSTMFDLSAHYCCHDERGWYAWKKITPEQYRHCLFETQHKMANVGMIATVLENHDQPRAASQFLPKEQEHNDRAKKMLGVSYFFLRGIPFLYQGQEIGMENTTFSSIDEVDDINTLDEYAVARAAGLGEKEALEAVAARSRDNARTPMAWSAGANGGFSAAKPWMACNPSFDRINVESQYGRKDSVLEFYRSMLALRKKDEYRETFVYGETVPYLEHEKNLLAYLRRGQGQDILVLCNTSAEKKTAALPGLVSQVLLDNTAQEEPLQGNTPEEPLQDNTSEKPLQGNTLKEPLQGNEAASGAKPGDSQVCLEGYQALVLLLAPEGKREYTCTPELLAYMDEKGKHSIVVELVECNNTEFEMVELHVQLADEKRADFFHEKKGYGRVKTSFGEVLLPRFKLEYSQRVEFHLKKFLFLRSVATEDIRISRK